MIPMDLESDHFSPWSKATKAILMAINYLHSSLVTPSRGSKTACLEDHSRTCKWLITMVCKWLEGVPQPYLGDLLTTVINHLLTGMIVPPSSVVLLFIWVKKMSVFYIILSYMLKEIPHTPKGTYWKTAFTRWSKKRVKIHWFVVQLKLERQSWQAFFGGWFLPWKVCGKVSV